MKQVIVAFERQSNCERLREILEGSGEFSCLVCRDAGQVRRAVGKLRLDVVVCGFKLVDESCESMFYDLPRRCAMLMIAPQSQLELCEAEGVSKLATPIRRTQLLSSVRRLTQGRERPPVQRTREEQELVEQAKAELMSRRGMSEEQAHRFLQKRSMDRGAHMADTARQVLDEI